MTNLVPHAESNAFGPLLRQPDCTTVLIPADRWISVSNIGGDVIRLAFVFSAPGFEEFMRDASVREGENNVPLSKAEEDALEKKHSHAVIYE